MIAAALPRPNTKFSMGLCIYFANVFLCEFQWLDGRFLVKMINILVKMVDFGLLLTCCTKTCLWVSPFYGTTHLLCLFPEFCKPTFKLINLLQSTCSSTASLFHPTLAKLTRRDYYLQLLHQILLFHNLSNLTLIDKHFCLLAIHS